MTINSVGTYHLAEKSHVESYFLQMHWDQRTAWANGAGTAARTLPLKQLSDWDHGAKSIRQQ
jgi:hypothetical protein